MLWKVCLFGEERDLEREKRRSRERSVEEIVIIAKFRGTRGLYIYIYVCVRTFEYMWELIFNLR